VLLTSVFALGTIALGNLNLIAPVVAMFFLISYGLLNYATYFEAVANSPSFRPRFRFFNAKASLAGGILCLLAMLAINPTAGGIAIAVLFAIHQYVSRTVSVERWADSARAHRLQRVRNDLHAISADMEHSRDWRPALLAFSDDPRRRERILRFASWLEGGAGFTTAIRLLPPGEIPARKMRSETESELRAEIQRAGLPAFAKAIVSDDPVGALSVLFQSHGLGRVRANTALFNWYDAPETSGPPGPEQFGDYLRTALRFGLNLVVLSATADQFAELEERRPRDRRIDVWYRDNATGRLSLLLAYLMTRRAKWEGARIRLLARMRPDVTVEAQSAELGEMLEEIRIRARVEIAPGASEDEIARLSEGAGITLQPFRLDDSGPGCPLDVDLDVLLPRLGLAALVLAAEDIDLASDPEEGRHGLIARAVDEAERTARAAGVVEREAEAAAERLERARAELAAARSAGDDEAIARLEREAEKAEEEADHAHRRAARNRAKADSAQREKQQLTGENQDAADEPSGDD
jgi:hypothetical protein